MIEYSLGGSGQVVVLTQPVLNRFRRHRQRWYQRDAGGQLFARFVVSRIIIEEATGPRRSDVRSFASFRPNRRQEQAEILTRHRDGLHYIGDWHTHPQDIPIASPMDIESIGDCVRRSRHDLKGFLLIVVGRRQPPDLTDCTSRFMTGGGAALSPPRRRSGKSD
jgi:integrative and conjugative element protein (TIGR02256 family)